MHLSHYMRSADGALASRYLLAGYLALPF